VVSNLIFFVYFSFVHKRGSLQAIDYIRNDYADLNSLEIFMECYNTPLNSYIHKYNLIILNRNS
jgi:hypothetical protein